MFNKNKKNQKGFTLIEVMVVILIIAILASIGLPLYHKAILKARAAEAVNLLAMVRTKQDLSVANRRSYFFDFDQMPNGQLTSGIERKSSSAQATSNQGTGQGEDEGQGGEGEGEGGQTTLQPTKKDILISGDYEIQLLEQEKCAVVRYKPNGEEKFAFSMSYLKEGLSCSGSICSSFPNVRR